MIGHPPITRHRLRTMLVVMVAAGAWISTVLLPLGAGAATSTVSFGASADAFVTQSHPDTNYGARTQLKADGSPTQQSYLRFDIQGLSGTVTRAVLRLTAESSSATGYSVRSVASNSWGEKTITFANAPPVSSTVTASSGSFSAGQAVAVDITPLVAGNGSVSIALTTTSTSGITLDSREAGASLGPQLSVSTTTDAQPTNTSSPTISGTAQEGQTLTADPGTWSGTQPIGYAYQWLRCDSAGANCTDIAGATAKTYALVSAEVGSALRVAVTASNSAGSGSAASGATATITASGSVGYRDQSFTGAGTAPTGSKPESKLWWNDGAWWATLWAGSGKGFHIFRLDGATQRWSDTGVQLDDRSGTRADALWDGTHLYVASHVNSACGCSTSSPGYPSRLYRYSYDAAAGSYRLDTGFPVQINNTQTETLVIDRDSAGVLWATWAQDSKVMISHTQNGDDHSWTLPSVVPVAGASNLKSDDISSVVAFGGSKIGVMWSNQNDSTMYFAYHVDGAADSSWTVSAAARSPLIADDHINLKSLQSDGSGRVFAITKTSLNDVASPDANAPLVLLLVRNAAAGWSMSTVWRIGDGDMTRPILLIDEANLVLHAFATSSTAGGTIREKTSPVNSISFATGLGTTFMKDAASNSLNNATSTKQNLTHATGLVLLASNDATGFYWHNYEPLP
jgi:hypothetical protein